MGHKEAHDEMTAAPMISGRKMSVQAEIRIGISGRNGRKADASREPFLDAGASGFSGTAMAPSRPGQRRFFWAWIIASGVRSGAAET